MEKSLDRKLARIRQGSYTPADFIIADAKDGDMGGGITAFGPKADDSGHCRSFPEHLDAMRHVTGTGLVDVMLMSASAAERLGAEGVFADSPVTPAARLNDATDIWGPRHSGYRKSPAQDFRTPRLKSLASVVDLGLYSITFSNDLASDVAFQNGFHRFLDDLSGSGIRYFLEVFNPQIDIGIAPERIPDFVNDCIVRCLAGLTEADRPQFLKIQFNGPRAMEEICRYDPGHLVVGVLGGGAGTTRDTLELVRQSEKYGARVALFGRKILFSEDPEQTLRTMRAVVEGDLSTEEAVKAYHAHLAAKGVSPKRSLEDDLEVTEPALMRDV
ncbi:MAG: hypothetical protein OXC01_14810 [Immundisolibacterales bacterium]|nr:hypothetical protein [Immundisolibacterales bacterium]